MKFSHIFSYKLILLFSNFTFSACGIALLYAGYWLFADSKRILISRLIGASSDPLLNLPQPFFYYVALGFATSGLIAVFTSIIGWWASCLKNYYILSIYFLVVLSLLLIEFAFCSLMFVWPQCLGLNLDEFVLVKLLQSSYGVPGKEHITTSIDLLQTYYKCCAISSNSEYDMSLWRLQNYGKSDWAVPQTCCTLTNYNDDRSYLDPKPINISVCQSLLKHEYSRARHLESCFEYLSEFYHEHYILFIVSFIILGVVELITLLSIILNCTKLGLIRKRKKPTCRSVGTITLKRRAPQPQSQQQTHTENFYSSRHFVPAAYSYHMK